MTAAVPAALAVAGTALMAVAFFGPFRRAAVDDDAHANGASDGAATHWPELVEATARDCDAAARIDLADALGALRSAWSESILRKADEIETDPAVRAAISAALFQAQVAPSSSSQSLVT